VTGLNIDHMNKNGGLDHYIQLADQRSKILYEYIDNSDGFYTNSVDQKFRSKINVPFRIVKGTETDLSKNTDLETQFLELAAENGCVQLKGHSKNPGIRASMYNAMPLEGVHKLIEVMEEFK